MLILVGLGALAVALDFTDDISDGASWKFDTAILLALRVPGHPDTPIGPVWLRQSATDLSALGGFTLQWLLGSAAILYLLSIRRRAEAAWLAASVVGASPPTRHQDLLHRPRPQVVPHLAMVDNASFPSGHAMISAAILLTIGAMISETGENRASPRRHHGLLRLPGGADRGEPPLPRRALAHRRAGGLVLRRASGLWSSSPRIAC